MCMEMEKKVVFFFINMLIHVVLYLCLNAINNC